MNDPAITVDRLGKRYRIGRREERPDTLVGAAAAWLKAPLANLRRLRRLTRFDDGREEDVVWALRDVSFTIRRGEVVGIIGPNGAGKSTLLKVLSRITEPTTGRVVLNGRVASLLEVGTGFHPELTGRENVYLNGTLLGMTKNEVDRKLDEIVAFSGVERFIDTPVKRYSSGMQVRLAFAVAAHLEPEILLVDEVLAVGDAAFQDKCLGKMSEVSRAGRTVLFVSHQLGMVAQLCERAMLFREGRIDRMGPTEEVIRHYMAQARPAEHTTTYEAAAASDREAQILRACVQSEAGEPSSSLPHDEAILLDIECVLRAPAPNLVLGVAVRDRFARKVFTAHTRCAPGRNGRSNGSSNGRERVFSAVMRIPARTLTPGTYTFLIALHVPNVHVLDLADPVCPVQVFDAGSDFALHEGADYGVVFVDCTWEIRTLTPAIL